jgi:hypothetical protein
MYDVRYFSDGNRAPAAFIQRYVLKAGRQLAQPCDAVTITNYCGIGQK